MRLAKRRSRRLATFTKGRAMRTPFQSRQPRKMGEVFRLAPLLLTLMLASPCGVQGEEAAQKKLVTPAAEEVVGVPVAGEIIRQGQEVSQLPAQHAGSGASKCSTCSNVANAGTCCDCDGGCGQCGANRCRHVCGPHCRKLANRWANCNCDGSYKFPVPPLYTYHWPGIYSLQNVTDYHSPWRFPPLRPYAPEPDDETLAPAEQARLAGSTAIAVSWQTTSPSEPAPVAQRAGLPEPASRKLERLYGR